MTVVDIRLIQYDLLPVEDGWILRCAANGRIVLRTADGETTSSFESRVRYYCQDKATENRRVELNVHDGDGYLKGRPVTYAGSGAEEA